MIIPQIVSEIDEKFRI